MFVFLVISCWDSKARRDSYCIANCRLWQLAGKGYAIAGAQHARANPIVVANFAGNSNYTEI
jgi:hypothetical protein